MILATSIWWLYRSARRHVKADWGHAWMNWVDGLNRLYCLRYHRLEGDCIPLPEAGGAVVVANHFSGLDPCLLMASARRPLRFMIAREHYNIPGLRWFYDQIGCIPVDRKGRPEKALRDAIAALRQGEVIALFPHGKIHLRHHPSRKLKGGAVRLALSGECDIYPARIDGIAAEGVIVGALLKRSHATLEALPVVETAEKSVHELMDLLESLLNNPV
ncbi:MAG: lysophospholipid acyltransferase family protein [Pseudomonadota bacterium]